MRHIEQMQEIFRLFQSEVAYSRASFPEVCMAVSDRIAEPFRTVMKEIYAQVMEKSGYGFRKFGEQRWDSVWKICR